MKNKAKSNINFFRRILQSQQKSRIILISLSIIATLLFISVFLFKYATNIERSFPIIQKQEQQKNDKPIVYFGVVSRFSANIIYKGYQPLMDYLSENTPYQFELKLSNSYLQTVEQLKNNEVSAAFLGSFIYIQSRKDKQIFPILKPLNENGEPYFHSVLITKNDSPILSAMDLKGKKLALPSKQSFSGNWLPLYTMSKLNFGLDKLDSIYYFAHHHTVINKILKNKFDAGVVKDRVANEYKNKGIRILDYSMPIPGSPIVISKQTDTKISQAIIDVLLKIDLSQQKYRDLVKTWDKEFSYGFVIAKAKDYDQLANIFADSGDAK